MFNFLSAIVSIIRIIAYIMLIIVFILFINYVISNILIIRNTILWFLGESGMVGFMTIQAIWFFIFILLFGIYYKVVRSI